MNNTMHNNNTHQRSFFTLLHNNNISSCLAYFTSLEHTPWSYRDIEGYSPLHYAIYDDNTSFTYDILSLTKKRLNNAAFAAFINAQSKKGFTALHYAAMKGNIAVTKTLIANGADYALCNNAGANVLHIAAQYNRCNVIYYYIKTCYKNNTNVYMVHDYKGNTMLHWACYCKSDNAVKMLLLLINGMRNEMDIINAQAHDDGYTPLHYAIENDSERITKRLLLRGANKRITTTTQHQTVYDIALQHSNIKLISLLRNKNYKKLNKSLCSVVFFYSIHLLIPLCVLLFNSIYIDNDNIVILYIIWSCILFVFVYGNIIVNPRVIQYNHSDKVFLLDKLEEINFDEYCPICDVKCSETSNHCYVCNKCIDDFDHHCVWIGKCVGKGNMNWFYMSIVFVFVNIIIINAFVIYSETYTHIKTTHIHIIRECILKHTNMLLTFININININITLIKHIITLTITTLSVFSLIVLLPILTECIRIYCINKRKLTSTNTNNIKLITKPSL